MTFTVDTIIPYLDTLFKEFNDKPSCIFISYSGLAAYMTATKPIHNVSEEFWAIDPSSFTYKNIPIIANPYVEQDKVVLQFTYKEVSNV